jgi:cyclopropane fatty-acyl-phospholipid synthase-like methyltransferase
MAAPYDLIADRWARDRADGSFRERTYVDRFAALLSPRAHLLELGFGAGRPIGRYLLDQGFRVTGIDASREMLRLAAGNCPEAELIAADMLEFNPARRFDGIIAWDSVFHIPKDRHRNLFHSMREWLEPGGPLLMSLGGSDDEFTDSMYGEEFFYSAHAPAVSIAMLGDAGFEIVVAEVDDPTSRGHMAIICRTPGSRT